MATFDNDAQQTINGLAALGPKAVETLSQALDGTILHGSSKAEAARDILDRLGMTADGKVGLMGYRN